MAAGFSVDVTKVYSVVDYAKAKPGSVVKMSDEAVAAQRRMLDQTVPTPEEVKADNDPSNLYATVEKNGSTIATLYRSGLIVMPNAVRVPDDLRMDGHGTQLADARIDQITALYGGTVKYASQTKMQSAATTAATLFAAHLAGQ